MITSLPLPTEYAKSKGVISQVLLGLVSATGSQVGMAVAPGPVRSLMSQPGSLQVLLTWNSPAKSQGVAGYFVYQGDEGNRIMSINDPNTRQAKISVPASTPTAFYVSTFNKRGIEGTKIQVIGSANSDQLVSSGGTDGSSPSPPPGFSGEPSGGGIGSIGGGTGDQKRKTFL